ncbi:DinB family protein [Microlunatus speluncae]|uniref:DinB family protein n=1 Tax=Microlunatus speluncae TaxID=2594267 RepID=UPI001375DD29|nr:DinB family protein [Microlunatus speluncae]
MATIWLTSIAERYGAVLDDLAIGIRTCPDELWEESLYPVDPAAVTWTPIDPEGRGFEDEAVAERKRRAQGAVWRTAAHALYYADADLSVLEQDWEPQAPLSLGDEDENVVPPTYSREQLSAYVDYCRRKVDVVFAELTDARAEKPVVVSHRHRGTPVGKMLVVGLVHLQQHTAQLRAYLVTRGVPWTDE